MTCQLPRSPGQRGDHHIVNDRRAAASEGRAQGSDVHAKLRVSIISIRMSYDYEYEIRMLCVRG